MEIVEDSVEKSYNNNNGKPWKSSTEIFRDFAIFLFFFLHFHFSLIFLIFLHFSSCSLFFFLFLSFYFMFFQFSFISFHFIFFLFLFLFLFLSLSFLDWSKCDFWPQLLHDFLQHFCKKIIFRFICTCRLQGSTKGSRCSMVMWCLDDIGRDSWNGVGPRAWIRACFNSLM